MKRLLFSLPLAALLLALSCSAASAQSGAAPAASNAPVPLAAPVQTSRAVDKPLDPKLPTLFIVGDSTARNQADLGWGDHFAALFDTTHINIANRAVAGRSTRTFVSEGRWEKVVAELKPGDYVILQLGHNDGAGANDPKRRGSLPGNGDETLDVPYPDGKIETVLTYGGYTRKFIADVRAHQATPILMVPTVRNKWTKGPDGNMHVEHVLGGYSAILRQIATDQKVIFADMGGIEGNVLEKVGQDRCTKLFQPDATHTTPEGAEMNAKIAALSLVQAKVPVVNYLLPKSLDNLIPAK